MVAAPVSASRTCCGVASGFVPSTSAAAPATCGAAIEVPLIVAVAVSPVRAADRIRAPGANRSRQLPQFENDARASALSEAPTVMPAGSRAGDDVHASRLSLPAASTYVTPELIERCTASSSDAEAEPPRLMLTTAGLTALRVTQSTPAMICE